MDGDSHPSGSMGSAYLDSTNHRSKKEESCSECIQNLFGCHSFLSNIVKQLCGIYIILGVLSSMQILYYFI